MKNKRYLALLIAMVCALCVAGLAGCGGNSSAPAASGGSAAPVVSDEDLIKQDVENVIGTAISKEELLQGLREDQQIAEFEAAGFDAEAYAENMANIFKFEVDSVEVDGDTAVAYCKLTVPNFGDEMEARVVAAVEEASTITDVAAMSEDEQMAFIMGILSDVMAAPDFPTETTDFNIDYIKDGDTWVMKDKDSIEESLSEIGNAAAGL